MASAQRDDVACQWRDHQALGLCTCKVQFALRVTFSSAGRSASRLLLQAQNGLVQVACRAASA
jgi:hypothetical protein